MLVSMNQEESNKAEWRRRVEANSNHDREQIQDWFNGNGGLVVAGVLVAVVIYFLVKTFLYGL